MSNKFLGNNKNINKKLKLKKKYIELSEEERKYIENLNNQNNNDNAHNINKLININYDIVFSLTCHENIDCVLDLYNNINKFCKLKFLLLISCTDNLYNDIKNLNIDNIIIINVRHLKQNIWGRIELFYQHMISTQFLQVNNINYTYFWFLASNELFIREITLDFLNQYVFKIENTKDINDSEYDSWYNNFINTRHEWMWYNEIKKDNYTMNKIRENKIIIHCGQHEGLVLYKDIINNICVKYNEMQINNNSSYREWVAEEIFIYSYIYSKYNLNKHIETFTQRFINNLKINDPVQLVKTCSNNNNILSIKPIHRDYNNPLRTYIRNM
jgi:hypothetical protein